MTRRLPNLNQLRAFEAAARHLSFTRAASELNVTQTAVSHRIRELEADLGEALFHRRVRAISLTPRAEELARSLAGAFDQIGAAVEGFGRTEMTGDLRISVAPFFGNRVLLALLPAFHRDHPGLRVLPTMSTDIVDLESGSLDAALRHGDGEWKGLEAIKVFTDELSAVVAPDLISGQTTPLTASAICRLDLASGADGAADWADWFKAAGIAFDGARVTTYPTHAGTTDIALSGLGAALCEQRLVAEDVAARRLVELHPVRIPARKSIYLVYPKAARPDPRLIHFANWLRGRLSPPQ